jgi:biopolymer transport protein ExbB/TolQ
MFIFPALAIRFERRRGIAMIIALWVVAALGLAQLVGVALLFRLFLVRFRDQQRDLAALRDDMARLFGDAQDGELSAILRRLDQARARIEEEHAERLAADLRHAQLTEESRRDRDWGRMFGSDR